MVETKKITKLLLLFFHFIIFHPLKRKKRYVHVEESGGIQRKYKRHSCKYKTLKVFIMKYIKARKKELALSLIWRKSHWSFYLTHKKQYTYNRTKDLKKSKKITRNIKKCCNGKNLFVFFQFCTQKSWNCKKCLMKFSFNFKICDILDFSIEIHKKNSKIVIMIHKVISNGKSAFIDHIYCSYQNQNEKLKIFISI